MKSNSVAVARSGSAKDRSRALLAITREGIKRTATENAAKYLDRKKRLIEANITLFFGLPVGWEASEASFTIGKQFEKTEKNEFSHAKRRRCRDRSVVRRNPNRDGTLRHSFASPSRTPVTHSSGGVCCHRCVPIDITVSLATPATGSLPVRGGIFRRSRPPHFSFPTPPTPVISRVRRVATVRGGEVRAAIHAGMVGLNRAEGHRNGHTEDCTVPVPHLECDCTPTAGGGGWPRFQPPARLRVSPRVWNGRARGTGERRRTLRDHGDT